MFFAIVAEKQLFALLHLVTPSSVRGENRLPSDCRIIPTHLASANTINRLHGPSPIHPIGAQTQRQIGLSMAEKMTATNIEQRALRLLDLFERAGKSVSGVTIEGRKIEITLFKGDDSDEFDRIGMRHDQT